MRLFFPTFYPQGRWNTIFSVCQLVTLQSLIKQGCARVQNYHGSIYFSCFLTLPKLRILWILKNGERVKGRVKILYSPMQPAVGDPASAGVGLDDPQRSLPTPTILWFCDYVIPGTHPPPYFISLRRNKKTKYETEYGRILFAKYRAVCLLCNEFNIEMKGNG